MSICCFQSFLVKEELDGVQLYICIICIYSDSSLKDLRYTQMQFYQTTGMLFKYLSLFQVYKIIFYDRYKKTRLGGKSMLHNVSIYFYFGTLGGIFRSNLFPETYSWEHNIYFKGINLNILLYPPNSSFNLCSRRLDIFFSFWVMISGWWDSELSKISEVRLEVFGEMEGEFSLDKLPWLDCLFTNKPGKSSWTLLTWHPLHDPYSLSTSLPSSNC